MTALYCTVCVKPRAGVIVRKGMVPVCESCATPLIETPKKKTVVVPRPSCPQCGCAISTVIEPERYQCVRCSAVFEKAETNHVGHRPEANAISKEEYEIRKADRQLARRKRS